MIRGVRGATTTDTNTESDIVLATEKLLRETIDANQISPEQAISVFISATEDLTAAFPAKALRNIDGWTYVPVMCMKEMSVPGGLVQCIRIMIHFNTNLTQKDVKHIYLERAIGLRPDL